MRIKNLDTSKYKRFFAFGCSFTNYIWPTWADIIGQDIEVYQNWGKQGAGNHYIFNSVMECDSRNHFNQDDLVIVMWSAIEREDRYSNKEWLVAVSDDDKKRLYGRKWLKSFGEDYRSCLIRDMAFIKATQSFLNSKGCDWINSSMYSICKLEEKRAYQDGYKNETDIDMFIKRYLKLNRDLCDGREIKEYYAADVDVLKLYKDVYSNIEYSVLDVVRNGYLFSEHQANFGDGHPTPIEHLKYLDIVLPNNISKRTRQFVLEWQSVVQSIKERDIMPKEFKRTPVDRL
jgi:hypothetical protein